MSRGINRIILIGNLGQDPEVRQTTTGKTVTNLRVATSDSWKDKQTGEQREQTEWHSVVMFDRLAEIAAEYLRKGSQVYLEGKLRTRKWQDRDGNDRWTTEVHANEMQMLGGRGDGGGPRDSGRTSRSSTGSERSGRGRLASGEQWFAFVHIKDVLSAFWFACNYQKAGGIYNLTAPQNITNRKFAQVLGKTMHRPAWLPVPQWLLKLLMGEAAMLITRGQYVKSHRLPHDGFMFEYPSIEKTVKDLEGK